MDSLADVWKSILEILGKSLTSVAISTWFDECRIIELSDMRLVLFVASEFKKDIIESRFTGVLKDALYELFACDFEILFIGEGELGTFDESDRQQYIYDRDAYTFGSFIVGPQNKFAHAAAMAVAEGKTKTFNPLFIYGDSGLGKTHLLHAIRHEVKKRHPEYHIVYVKGDTFTNELIAAIQSGKNIEFREKYRNADLFLMDDVQFIAGKESTQEEFFHTFNTLYEAQHQIVFTSDRPPSEIMRLADRLRTRFESGILADVQPPDYETRMAIIKNKSQQLGLMLSEDVVNYIAENMTANVRQIEGIVKKLRAYKDIMDETLTVSSVSKIMKDMYSDKNAFGPTPEIIIEETAKYYNLTVEELKSQRRTRNTALARQISMYQIKRLLPSISLNSIGDLYEGRDHTTVLSSINKIEKKIAESPEFAQTIKDITANINARN